MIRRNDLSGAHEWMGADELIRSLIVWRLSARKISVSCRFVMSRVFDGGVGGCNGGMQERSIDRGVRGREEAGDVSVDMML